MWRHAPKKNTVRKKQFGKLFNIKKGIHDRIFPFHKTASPFGHFLPQKNHGLATIHNSQEILAKFGYHISKYGDLKTFYNRIKESCNSERNPFSIE
jgi:hypothetical protein